MEWSAWDLVIVACKWLQLLAMAGVIGGGFTLLLARHHGMTALQPLQRYLRLCAVAGLITVPLFLLLETGAVNQGGLAGMADAQMAGILLQSDLGTALQLRALAFAVVLAMTGTATAVVCSPWCRWNRPLAAVMAVTLLLWSFLLTGHVSNLSSVESALLGLHVAMVLVWTGSLFPLLLLCRSADVRPLQTLLRGFGQLAVGVVAILLVAGTSLLMQLVPTFSSLWTTSYGITLSLKLVAVAALLAMAALNKLTLVPRLTQNGVLQRLRWSIRTELVLASSILAVTAWLTTLESPAA